MKLLVAATLALASQVVQAQAPADSAKKKDPSRREVNVTIGAGQTSRRSREPRRKPLTPELEASAFRDATARALLTRARAARMAQDSALTAYDATAYQRISAGMGLGRLARDRLIFRTESVGRVRWQRDVGAWVDVKGSRTAIPIAPDEAQAEASHDIATGDVDVPIPYYPGYEPLWIGGGMAKSQVDERELVNPLAGGSEAYYTYETGDSVRFRLPNGHEVRLRELRVRPRRPAWNVAVGSLWFDAASGQLVRAAYRLSTPIDVWATVKEEDSTAAKDVPLLVKGLISPMKAEISAIAIEYGLYEGRFWLPRLQTAEGGAQVSFMHVPFKFEQSFRYASVNGRDSLPRIVLSSADSARLAREAALDAMPDSVRERLSDSLRTARRDSLRALRLARRDSVKKGLLDSTALRNTTVRARERIAQCGADTAGTTKVWTSARARTGEGGLRVALNIPCDPTVLASAPELPKSIFDPGEEIFGSAERDALVKQALSMGAQAEWAPQPPVVHTGLDLLRYNRVEGLSLGATVDAQLGAGYTAHALGRIGTADREPNVELALARSDAVASVRVAGYNRLVVANDWGQPLSFGSSLSALLFGRDEGFYYRASGAELGGTRDGGFGGAHADWRVFLERQRAALPNTSFSLGATFLPNIDAHRDTYAGAEVRLDRSYGLDPKGLRLLTGLRLEAATSTRSGSPARPEGYGRAALDLTASRGLGGDVLGSLTLSGGSSLGDLPPQRQWYLGGAWTVRGERPDPALGGTAYWLTQAELGREMQAVRMILFSDLGWAGDRARLRDGAFGRPMSDVGVGASMLDGMIRLDLARGLYPEKRFRMNLYLEARM